MISHVLLIFSSITGEWFVRIMYRYVGEVAMHENCLCFDCSFNDEKSARTVAEDVAKNLKVPLMEGN